MRNGSTTKCCVINVYGPTAERAREDPTLVDALYNELGSAITIPSRWQLFICGDFNSMLGKVSQEDREAGLTTCMGSYGSGKRNANGEAGLTMCMGSYGSGKRNANGEALSAFTCAQGLFATNMAFKYPCQH